MTLKTDFQNYICRPYCSFFREGEKEEMACRAARAAAAMVEQGLVEPQGLFFTKTRRLWEKHRPVIEPHVCLRCSWRAEDCDFQSDAPESGPEEIEPCGGYIFLCLLLENALADEKMLRSLMDDLT
jgi:hypothetical protein